MLFQKNVPLNILLCHTCNGSGYVKFRQCSECRGMSAGRLVRNMFLYWGEPLSHYHIAVRKARRVLNKFRIIGAIIFGLGFWGLLLFFLYSNNSIEKIFGIDFWVGGNKYPSLFWLGVIAFSYLFYRSIISTKVQDTVELREYNNKKEKEGII